LAGGSSGRRDPDGAPLRGVGSLSDVHAAKAQASAAEREPYQRKLELGLEDVAGIV
jgi:hypothetical protein